MTYVDAAIEVLRSASPMTVSEITAEALRRGLIASDGKTPDQTMRARLYTYVRDSKEPVLARTSAPETRRARRGSVLWRYVS